MNLETIVNILVDNAKEFGNRNHLDMSMFPENEVPRIFAAAAEETLRMKDYDSTSHYLYLGKHWARLLELGVPFFHSKDKEEQKFGKQYLEILMYHDKLPKEVAIELADYILKHDGEHSRYRAAKALAAGNAIEKAEQVAYQFFNEGNLEDGESFFQVTGKKLNEVEVERFAGIALEQGNYRKVLELYEAHSIRLPKERAKAIIAGSLACKIRGRANFDGYTFDWVMNYMAKAHDPFTQEEFKEIADTVFKAGEHGKALELYGQTGKLISPEEYRVKGEQILSQAKEIEKHRNCSNGQVWPSLSTAFAYLSKSDFESAKQKLAQYADSLLDQPEITSLDSNVSAFNKIYEMIGMPLPICGALKAARYSEGKQQYPEAAKFYAAAGMMDAAKRMGHLALKSKDKFEREYDSKRAFEIAGDKDGIAVAQFLEKNLRS